MLPASPGYMGNVAQVYFIVWLVLGVVLYLAGAGHRSSLTEEERAADLFAGMQQ